MDKRIAIIVPYFGKLPDCFPAWWTSAIRNPMLEFWFFTDNEKVTSEKNIIVKHIGFSDFVSILQKKFDFRIRCDKPYKLCDYKPTYGDVFEEELKGYEYWGYCDVDLVFGNVQDFITECMLEEHDKILIDGHFSIFKNNDRMNKLYKSKGVYPEYDFEEAFTTSDSCYFDEYRGMELKLIREKCKVYYDGNIYINADPKRPVFSKNGERIVGIWEDGDLFQVDEDGKRKKLLYFHVCKRKMGFENKEANSSIRKISIVPGKIMCNDDIPTEKLFEFSSGGRFYPYFWAAKRLNAQLERYSIFKIIKLNIRRKQVAREKARLLAEISK